MGETKNLRKSSPLYDGIVYLVYCCGTDVFYNTAAKERKKKKKKGAVENVRKWGERVHKSVCK